MALPSPNYEQERIAYFEPDTGGIPGSPYPDVVWSDPYGPVIDLTGGILSATGSLSWTSNINVVINTWARFYAATEPVVSLADKANQGPRPGTHYTVVGGVTRQPTGATFADVVPQIQLFTTGDLVTADAGGSFAAFESTATPGSGTFTVTYDYAGAESSLAFTPACAYWYGAWTEYLAGHVSEQIFLGIWGTNPAAVSITHKFLN